VSEAFGQPVVPPCLIIRSKVGVGPARVGDEIQPRRSYAQLLKAKAGFGRHPRERPMNMVIPRDTVEARDARLVLIELCQEMLNARREFGLREVAGLRRGTFHQVSEPNAIIE
jgi:hypothetical protein